MKRRVKIMDKIHVSALIEKDLHKEVKMLMVKEGTNFNRLIRDLLYQWVKEKEEEEQQINKLKNVGKRYNKIER
jgi:hypothetical protein